jgi:type I restriction-modification system DNA methylase subunit
MRAGGFDCVIGNPPYVRIQQMKEWAPVEVEYYKEHYKSASSGNYDIYVVFVEKGLSVLNQRGRLGFILPHKFFNARYGEQLRAVISEGKHLSHIVHFGDQQVFEGATNYTCLLLLDKAGNKEFDFEKVEHLQEWRETGKATKGTIPTSRATAAEWNFAVGEGAQLRDKLRKMPLKLGDVADIFVGLQTSADDVFILELIEKRPRSVRLMSKALKGEVTLEKELLFPLVSGTDVRRYTELPERQYVVFPYRVAQEKPSLIPIHEIREKYPKTADYLLNNRKRLEEREAGKFRGQAWYRFGRSQNIGIQGRAKVCVPRLVDRLHAACDSEGTHYLDNVDVGGITLKREYKECGLPYLVGLLNSKLLCWYFPFVSAPFRGGYLSANRQFLSQLPIRPINFSAPADKARHDRMVALVERMLELNTQKHSVPQSGIAHSELERLERDIVSTDAEIDELVCELYGITQQERKIIERR